MLFDWGYKRGKERDGMLNGGKKRRKDRKGWNVQIRGKGERKGEK